jgi:hypothetical protein
MFRAVTLRSIVERRGEPELRGELDLGVELERRSLLEEPFWGITHLLR